MNPDNIYDKLRTLLAVVDGWRTGGTVPAIERDIVLAGLRTLYEELLAAGYSPLQAGAAARFAEREETPAADEESQEIIDIVLDDAFEPGAAPESESAEEYPQSGEDTPAAEPEKRVTGWENTPAATAEEPESEPGYDAGTDSSEPAGVSDAEDAPATGETSGGIVTAEPVSEGEKTAADRREETSPAHEDAEEAAGTADISAERETGEMSAPAPARVSGEVTHAAADTVFAEDIVSEPAKAPEETAVQADGMRDGIQSNLFDLGSITPPRRSRQRMMSLYEEELFDNSRNERQAAPQPPVRTVVSPYGSAQEEPAGLEVVEIAEEPEPKTAANESTDGATAAEPAAGGGPAAESRHENDADAYDEDEIEVVEFGGEPSEESEPEEPAAAGGFDIPAAAQEKGAVLGDVVNSGVQTLGDTMAPAADTAADVISHAPVTDLRSALNLSDRFRIAAELFGGDDEACDRALAAIDGMESIEDAVIYIEENYSWHPTSEAALLVMELLERKFSRTHDA